MNIPLGICFLMMVIFVRAGEKYTAKFDNIDYEEILRSERLLKNYIFCLLDKGPCSPDGLGIKNILADALETECSKCSDRQKEGSTKVIRFLIENHAGWWKELTEKYDPDGIFMQKYRDQWNSNN
uniref:Chemosensory protein 4 n=1 Tax=Colaphellus bowringi TaxID=561076 RepID=A0A0S3J3C5_9CUCU|nr:chemosensory protein 4 [Colaphellus bowringi]